MIFKDRIKSLKRIPASKLIVNEKNWRKHPDSQRKAIRTVLDEVGFASACLVRTDIDGKYHLIDGHLRADLTGKEKIPCLMLDVTEDEADLLLATFDPITNMADTDQSMLDDLIGEIDTDSEDVQALLDSLSSEKEEILDGLTEDDDIPEPAEVATVQLGEVWILGNHRLICGDSTDKDLVSELMDGEKCDYVFTSPPYNIGASIKLHGNTHMTESLYKNNEDDKTESDFLDFLIGFTEAWLEHCKCMTVNIQQLAGNKIAVIEYLHAFRNKFIDMAIWHKGWCAPVIAPKTFNSCFEYMIFLSSKDKPNRAIPTATFDRGTLMNIYEGSSNRDTEFSEVHGAVFPIDLPLWAIENFSAKGDIVGECFGGTGTTLIACEKTGRKCRIMELDEIYCDVIIKRWQDFTGNKAIRKSDGIEFGAE